MRRVSLNARTAHDAETTDEVEVVLVEFDHADLEAPIRVSSDPTELLTPAQIDALTAPWVSELSRDQVYYVTRSAWNGADPVTEPFFCVAAYWELPGDMEDTPAAGRLVLDFMGAALPALLRSFATQPTVSLAVVLASAPDDAEVEFAGLVLDSADWDATSVTLEISRIAIEEEAVPTDIMTKSRFPGLWR